MKTNILFLCFLLTSISALAIDTLRVHTPDDFLKAIGPDRVILIECDTLQLRKIPALSVIPEGQTGDYDLLKPYVKYIGGNGVIVEGVNGMQIIGRPKYNTCSIICTSDYQNEIMTFRNCSDLKIRFIEFNHLPRAIGGCTGGVLFFDKCGSVDIFRCHLIGSGAHGLLLANDTAFSCRQTLITECSQLLFEIYGCSNLDFDKCIFSFISSPGRLIEIEYSSSGIHFTGCRFENNLVIKEEFNPKTDTSYIFNFYEIKSVPDFVVKNCHFINNDYQKLSSKKGIISFQNNKYSDNAELNASENN